MKRRISLVFLSMLLLFAALLPRLRAVRNRPPSLRLKRFGCKTAALTSATLSGSTG